MSRRRALFAGFGLAVVVLTKELFDRVDIAPLVWSAMAWSTLAVAGRWSAQTPRARLRWMNVLAACLAVAFIEGFLWIQSSPNQLAFGPEFSFEGSYYEPQSIFIKPDTTLGYRPRPGAKARAIKKYRGEVVYDVEYGIGEDGLRTSPPNGDGSAGCVLFFGDSLAWGEGVADTETTAYQLGLMSAGKYRVHNFAVTGYSAHQLAAQVERGVVAKASTCRPDQPVHVVYQVLPNNVARAAGLGAWDEYGPRYVLTSSGKVSRHGYFSRGDYILNDRVRVPRNVLRYVAKTMLYERAFGRLRRTNAFDLARFVKIAERGLNALADQMPNVKVLVIVWYDMDEDGGRGKRTEAMHDSFKALAADGRGLDVRYVGEVIPDYDRKLLDYHIPNDGHPTAEAHRLVAAFVHRYVQAAAPSVQPVVLGSTSPAVPPEIAH